MKTYQLEGVYQSDLTFIGDGNPDTLDNGYINFFKRQLVAEVIKEVQLYQQVLN
jgi:son of sevenless-like protein